MLETTPMKVTGAKDISAFFGYDFGFLGNLDLYRPG